MAIDASIALGIKPMQITSQEDYLKDIYATQNAQQANQLNRMKMNEYSRGVAQDEAIRNDLANAKSSEDVVNTLNKYGKTKEAADYAYRTAETGKVGAEVKNLGYVGDKTQAETEAAKLESAHKRLDIMGKAFGYVRNNPTPQAAGMALKHLRDSGIIDDAKANELWQQVMADPTKIKDMADMAFTSTLQAKDQLPNFISQQNIMVNGVPTTRELQVSPLGGAATTVPGSSGATYNKPAANINVNTNLPAQEKEFEKELGSQQAKKVVGDKVKAEDAAQILATNQVAKNLLDQGMLTGVGAEFFTKLNQGLSQAGIDFGYGNDAKNAQAYGGLMATNTAKLIKNFGAGTGLSDADRIYAKQAAAGDITMDEKAIRKLIDINSRAAQNAIKLHNKNVSGIKTNIPLTVNPEDYSAGIPEGRAGGTDTRKPLKDIFK